MLTGNVFGASSNSLSFIWNEPKKIHSHGINNKNLLFSPLTDIVSKCNFRVVMFSCIVLPFALGFNIIKHVYD